MQIGTIGSHKFVREAEAIELVLFSTRGKSKSHVNIYRKKLMTKKSLQRNIAEIPKNPRKVK